MHYTNPIFIGISILTYIILPQVFYFLISKSNKISKMQHYLEFIFSLSSYSIITWILLYYNYGENLKYPTLLSQIVTIFWLLFIPILIALLRYRIFNSNNLEVNKYSIFGYTLYIYVWIIVSFIMAQIVLLISR